MCSIHCVFSPHDMNVFVTALTADNVVTHMQGFSSGFYGQPPYLVITVHINCRHVRGPLHHILVITMHDNSHTWGLPSTI